MSMYDEDPMYADCPASSMLLDRIHKLECDLQASDEYIDKLEEIVNKQEEDIRQLLIKLEEKR